jgi:hypothetical protein
MNPYYEKWVSSLDYAPAEIRTKFVRVSHGKYPFLSYPPELIYFHVNGGIGMIKRCQK